MAAVCSKIELFDVAHRKSHLDFLRDENNRGFHHLIRDDRGLIVAAISEPQAAELWSLFLAECRGKENLGFDPHKCVVTPGYQTLLNAAWLNDGGEKAEAVR